MSFLKPCVLWTLILFASCYTVFCIGQILFCQVCLPLQSYNLILSFPLLILKFHWPMTHVFSSKHSIIFCSIKPFVPCSCRFLCFFPDIKFNHFEMDCSWFSTQQLIIGITLSSVCYSTFQFLVFSPLVGCSFHFYFPDICENFF